MTTTARIDLHCHTTASDGTDTPTELVQRAATLGLSAVAVTDHDVMDGVAEATAEGRRLGVRVVPGVEISLEYKGPKVEGRSGWMHLLVYFLKEDGSLAGRLRQLQQWRVERNRTLLDKLVEMGMPMTLEELHVLAKGQLGRPHFAALMVQKGYVKTTQEAFDNYLGKGSAGYVEKQRLYPEEALSMTAQEGAVAVLAHPYSLGLSSAELAERLPAWVSHGLGGLEVEYPLHDATTRKALAALADSLGLVKTGGSDYHGANKPDIRLGTGRDDNIFVPASVLAQLEAACG